MCDGGFYVHVAWKDLCNAAVEYHENCSKGTCKAWGLFTPTNRPRPLDLTRKACYPLSMAITSTITAERPSAAPDAGQPRHHSNDPETASQSLGEAPRAARAVPDFRLLCGGCGGVMWFGTTRESVSFFRCFRCKRTVVRQDLPSDFIGAESEITEGEAA